MAAKPTHIIYLPGLNSGKWRYGGLVRWWKFYGVEPHYFPILWNAEPAHYQQSEAELLKLIDQLTDAGFKVGIVGASAGASLAINIYAQRPSLTGAVSICGKLDNLQTISAATLSQNPVFKVAVASLNSSLKKLKPSQLDRILLLQPMWDGVVSPADNFIKGAQTQRFLSVGHGVSIIVAVTVLAPKIAKFLK